ncbi:MAG TPA: TetR/AcrR family transcriptional regulator [Gemmatimonadales bacterium]|nr:TetR/AcrR family transcriptional regulator [Gemmatimonadales bacterium]
MAKKPARRRRQPDVTRERLLQAAFEEIYRRGYQAASLDTILHKAGVTKGALYHHFPDKAALGQAVVDDIVSKFLLDRWLGVLEKQGGDPLTALQGMLKERSLHLTSEEVELGCPLNNLAQEMSPLDEGFRRRVAEAYASWIDGFAKVLQGGQAEGSVRPDLDPKRIATFLVAAIEGSFGVAKGARSAALLRANLSTLSTMLDSLRPESPRGRRAHKAGRARSEPGR